MLAAGVGFIILAPYLPWSDIEELSDQQNSIYVLVDFYHSPRKHIIMDLRGFEPLSGPSILCQPFTQ